MDGSTVTLTPDQLHYLIELIKHDIAFDERDEALAEQIRLKKDFQARLEEGQERETYCFHVSSGMVHVVFGGTKVAEVSLVELMKMTISQQ